MKRHIASFALALAALAAASQVQAQGWDSGRSHGNSNRHYERADHRSWQADRRGGDSWRRSWHEPWRDADRSHWRGSWQNPWREGYRERYWSEPRGWYDAGRYWRPRYRNYDHDYDRYDYDSDGDISLLISLPLQF